MHVAGEHVSSAFRDLVRKPEIFCASEETHEDSCIFRSKSSSFEKVFFRLSVVVSSLIALNGDEVDSVVFRGISG